MRVSLGSFVGFNDRTERRGVVRRDKESGERAEKIGFVVVADAAIAVDGAEEMGSVKDLWLIQKSPKVKGYTGPSYIVYKPFLLPPCLHWISTSPWHRPFFTMSPLSFRLTEFSLE